MLLALRDKKGTLEGRAGMYRFALGGAILAELVLAGRVSVGRDKKKLVDVQDGKKLNEPILEECLKMISSAKRRRSAQAWVSKFSGISRLRHRVAEGLCRRGILRDSEDKVLLFFTRKLYPTIDPAPERALRSRIRRAVASDSRKLGERTGILVALAHATGLLRVHFDRHELKSRKKRLEAISQGDLVGGATGEAVRAAQAAVMMAVIAATTVATTASRH